MHIALDPLRDTTYNLRAMTQLPSPDLEAHAQAALCSRRYPADLLQRIDALSVEQRRASPWLALFQGRRLCRLHSRFAEAASLIAEALAVFRARRDAEATLWALAEHVVMCYHQRAYAEGLALADEALKTPIRPYLRAELEFGRFLCLIGQEYVLPSISAGERALAALDQEHDPWLQRLGRIQMLRNIAAGYHYIGQTRRSVAAGERAVALALVDEQTADTRPWCYYELGLAYWRQGRLAQANEALDEARRLSEAWGHQALWRWAVAAQGHVLRDQGRLDAAMAAYHLANSWGEVQEGPVLMQIRQDRLVEARWSCSVFAEAGDGLWSDAGSQVLLALIELKDGNPQQALQLLAPVAAIYDRAGFEYHAATSRLYYASAALALNRLEEAADNLAFYLRFAARESVMTSAWWVPELIEPLLIFALRQGIEPSWAQWMLGHRFVPSPAPSLPHHVADESAELMIARRTQLALLPDAPPLMPDLDIAAAIMPAADVGGDFVGYFPFGAAPGEVRRQLGLAVGDISGKGLQAALLLSGAVVALNTVAANAAPPLQVAERLHAAIQPYTSRSRMNIALCYTLLSQTHQGWSVRTVGCGAIPPLIRRASGEVRWLDTAGLPLGTLARASYLEVTDMLAPGDILIVLSDGIVEAVDAHRGLFGFDRLARTLELLPGDADAQMVMSLVLRAVSRHTATAPQQDDITIVVVRALAGISDKIVDGSV
jgi:tetratricopeptide (TPR) repeat protein